MKQMKTPSKWRKHCRYFLNMREGGVLITAAIALPVLIIATALAVDYSRYLKASDYLQTAVDQAAVAAVAVDGQDRVAVANNFFSASMEAVKGQFHSVGEPSVTSVKDAEGLKVKVAAAAELKNYFGAFVGQETTAIQRRGTALRGIDNVEAVLALASGGTMCATKTRVSNGSPFVEGDTLIALAPDESCTHFNTMKQGVLEFVDILEENEAINSFKVGVVPYNTFVQMPDINNIPPTLEANEPDGFYSNLADAEPLSTVLPLTADLGRVRQHVDAMEQTPAGMAWARSDLATHVAGLMLDPAQSNYFPRIESPAVFTDAMTKKVVVLMTDGANIGCCYTNWPIDDFSNQYVYFYKPYNAMQRKVCDLLKQEGVTIFSILFDVNDGDPGGKEINNVFARCASGAYDDRGEEEDPAAMLKCSKKQNCYDIDDTEDLITAYRQIAQTFYKPVISE